MGIEWGLLQVPDIGQAFKQGYDGGRQRNALAAYAQAPDNPQALNALAEFQPEFVIKQKRIEAEAAQTQADAARKRAAEQMPIVSKLLGNVTDETSFQRARAAAQQAGLDVSNVPPNYSPEWVSQTKLLADAYNKDGGQALSTFGKIATDEGLVPGTAPFNARVTQLVKADALKTVPYAPGGGVAGVDTLTGNVNTIIQPNAGGAPTGAPVNGGGIREGSTATNPATGERIIFRGGQWVPMGGGSGNATGGFRP